MNKILINNMVLIVALILLLAGHSKIKEQKQLIMELEQEVSYMSSVIDSRAKFNLDK